MNVYQRPRVHAARSAFQQLPVAVEAVEDLRLVLRRQRQQDPIDADLGEYGPMLERGIVDPTKVTRSALQNAASVASMVLTTESMITEIPQEKPAMPAMPPGGGMDF